MLSVFTDPLAQELLIGAMIAAALILLGMCLGLAIASEQRAAGKDTR